MTDLFFAVLPDEIAARFSYLISLKPARWSKIDPWVAWNYLRSDSRVIVEWTSSCSDLLATREFSGHADAPVTVLRCGHDKPSLSRICLHEALVGNAAILEGFIAVVPGKLGLAINHDDGLCILHK